ncbi:MAG: HEAT repeat domain-containing protein, partial [Myxococcales bacterium]|nr:HEAT repeat domain-containing protein [Myxococcales bacterium]
MSQSLSADGLWAALQHPDAARRQLALIERADTLDPASLEPLLAAAVDSDATVRRLAVGMLEDIGDVRALPVVIRALGDADEG